MIENLIWMLTIFVLATYLIFETYAWGRYAFFAASVAVLLLSMIVYRGQILLTLAPFYIFMLSFSGYCLFSALWSINPSDSVQNAITIAQILLCAAMLYLHYQRETDVRKLLTVIMWTGYIVSIYAILFYGLENIMDAASGGRLENDFSNVNSIGMTAAMACIIQVHQWLYKQNRWSAVFVLPCIAIIAACQSRKALLLLIVGVFAIYVIKNRQNKDLLTNIVKIIFAIAVALALAVALYSLPIFSGVRERMDSLIAGMLGESGADGSTLLRQKMIALGWEWFLKHPFGGVGMGSAHILVGKYLGKDTYLHSNFIELLCSGGIAGFAVYYSMYVYLFFNLWKYRRADRRHFEIGFVWLAMMLILDYGMVSYPSKTQWFYLMVHFLNVKHLKAKYYQVNARS